MFQPARTDFLERVFFLFLSLLLVSIPGAAPSSAEPKEPGSFQSDHGKVQVAVQRLNDGKPILTQEHFKAVGKSSGGKNINGPHVIRVPEWVPKHERPSRNANYYMYFANHGGSYIAMAYAENPVGPWKLFNIGDARDKTLGLPEKNIPSRTVPGRGVVDLGLGNSNKIDTGDFRIKGHIASPDVHIDHENKRFIMYLHGGLNGPGQQTFVSVSKSGLNFNNPDSGGEQFDGVRSGFRNVVPGIFYFRVFQVDHRYFAFSNTGQMYRAPAKTEKGNPATHANADEPGGLFAPQNDKQRMTYWEYIPSERNPILKIYKKLEGEPTRTNNPDGWLGTDGEWQPRHFTILDHHENLLLIAYTAMFDKPERIFMTALDLTGLSDRERQNPDQWRIMKPMQMTLLKPKMTWEGADLKLTVSQNGSATGVRALRDPYLFTDQDGTTYLYYTGRGEEAIGVAEVKIRFR
jgi:hypothetical protein